MSAREFEGVEILLIDGNNLLHRVAGSVDPGAQRLLIARLRGAIPPTIATVMMLDGHADTGTSRKERIGKGFEIRHSGSISADDALLRLAQDTSITERHHVTVVSDDRRLRDRARGLGAMTQRLQWLEGILSRPQTSSIGAGVQPRQPDTTPTQEHEPWMPGRHATRKRGNPRRRAR